MTDVLMPALSPTMEEGTLAKWHVKVGDAVRSGDVIAEIETDKATMEVEAVDEGVVEALLVPEGTEEVKVNTPIARLKGEGEASTPSPPPQSAAPPAPRKEEKKPRLSAAAPSGQNKPDRCDPTTAPRPDRSKAMTAFFASPLARRMAEQAGIDLSQVKGSGPHGRIIRRDLEGLKARSPPQPAAQPAAAQPTGRRSRLPRRQPSRGACSRWSRWASQPGPTTSSRSTG